MSWLGGGTECDSQTRLHAGGPFSRYSSEERNGLIADLNCVSNQVYRKVHSRGPSRRKGADNAGRKLLGDVDVWAAASTAVDLCFVVVGFQKHVVQDGNRVDREKSERTKRGTRGESMRRILREEGVDELGKVGLVKRATAKQRALLKRERRALTHTITNNYTHVIGLGA